MQQLVAKGRKDINEIDKTLERAERIAEDTKAVGKEVGAVEGASAVIWAVLLCAGSRASANGRPQGASAQCLTGVCRGGAALLSAFGAGHLRTRESRQLTRATPTGHCDGLA